MLIKNTLYLYYNHSYPVSICPNVSHLDIGGMPWDNICLQTYANRRIFGTDFIIHINLFTHSKYFL